MSKMSRSAHEENVLSSLGAQTTLLKQMADRIEAVTDMVRVEREACAVEAETNAMSDSIEYMRGWNAAAHEIARRIRARK